MVSWSFLTSHARVLLCIARDPGVRLRDIAASLGITERNAHAIVTDLAGAGYLVKRKTAGVTATRSRPSCRCPGPAPGNPPSAKSSPCSPAHHPARCRRARASDGAGECEARAWLVRKLHSGTK
jgi:MarR family